MTDRLKPVEKQLEAYNARDIEAFVKCYADDVVVEDGKGNVRSVGIEPFRANYAELFASCPDLHCEIVNRIVLDEYILDEERVTGHRGGGERHVVAVYRVEHGLIQHVRFLS